MELVRIGTIHTPFTDSSGTPIQAAFGEEHAAEVEVFKEYAEGLDDIEGFDRIWLIYAADRARKFTLKVVPYRDTVERGVFATRSPSRPNSICISAVKLVARKGNMLEIAGVDMLDGSPLYDIKPYLPGFDSFPDSAGGWFDEVREGDVWNADERFEAGK